MIWNPLFVISMANVSMVFNYTFSFFFFSADLFMGTEEDIYYDCVKEDKITPALAMCSL